MRPMVLVATLCALAATGCGVSDDEAEVREVAERFYQAVRADDGAAACEQLSTATVEALEGQSGKSCAEAVTRLRYDGGRVEAAVVYVTNAKVDLTSGESAFLAEEAGAWRLVAVACRPETYNPRERPFECEVEA